MALGKSGPPGPLLAAKLGGGGALLIAKVDFKMFNFVEYSQ